MMAEHKNDAYIKKLKNRIVELEDQLRTDELTRILNRRGLMEYLDTMVNEVLFQFKHPDRRRFLIIKSFSLIFVDLDHFKSINDSYGHQMGDKVLRTVTTLVRDELRGVDIVGRYGGEEIIIGLIGANEDSATVIAEGIRKKIEMLNFEHDGRKFKVTASFGVSSLKAGMSLKSLISQADVAVYEAKETGRNKVVLYQSDLHSHKQDDDDGSNRHNSDQNLQDGIHVD